MVTKLLHTGVNQIELVVLDHVQLDVAVILQLTNSECPRLQRLVLSYCGLGSVAMSYLAWGKWPLLKELSLEGNELEDTAVDELFKRERPLLEELELTVRSLHGKVVTQWLGLSSDSVQEALRQPEQDMQVRELKIKLSGSNADMLPPLQHIRHVYPRLPVPPKTMSNLSYIFFWL